ncbi:MAG: beta-ketoacyl-ACP synthase II, partial [Chloroflexota bacterium]
MTDGQRVRVVVTGIGMVAPVGATREAAWEALKAGRSGISPITRVDASALETRFAGQAPDFDPVEAMGRKESRRADRYTQFAVAAAKEALAQSGLAIDERNAARVGVIIGSGMGGMETLEEGMKTLQAQGPGRISPFFMPMFLANMASGVVAMTVGAKGPNYSPVSACASSAHAIGEAAETIRRGWADAILAGGAEAPVTPLSIAGFNAMGALSTRNDDPQGASRPWDRGRDGFVLAEGSAMLVLEEADAARARGARILGELAGYGASADASHITRPAPGGAGALRAARRALVKAGIEPTAIDLVLAHATSTPGGDMEELAAIRTLLGDHGPAVSISALKGA